MESWPKVSLRAFPSITTVMCVCVCVCICFFAVTVVFRTAKVHSVDFFDQLNPAFVHFYIIN